MINLKKLGAGNHLIKVRYHIIHYNISREKELDTTYIVLSFSKLGDGKTFFKPTTKELSR